MTLGESWGFWKVRQVRQFGAPLGGEDGWERRGTEAEARPWCLPHWGPRCLLLTYLDSNLAALVRMASQSPGSWQAHNS